MSDVDDMSPLVLVRGAGDLATGILVRLVRSGYRVVALECAAPTAIRRTVAFAEAIYEGRALVEGVEARRVGSLEECKSLLAEGSVIPLLVDPEGSHIPNLAPRAVVDAIIAKRNLGTRRAMAELVIGLGPGFVAGDDVDLVIETNRGHDLGRIIESGGAAPDTGSPGEIGGETDLRVIHAPVAGYVKELHHIGDFVKSGETILIVKTNYDNFMMYSKIDGMLRGLIRPGHHVEPGFKIADIDPRGRREHCYTISDKARALGGSVLEALLSRKIRP